MFVVIFQGEETVEILIFSKTIENGKSLKLQMPTPRAIEA